MSNQYKDEFSNAEKELEDKSAYICDSCNKKYNKEEAIKKDKTCCGHTINKLIQEPF